MSCNLLRFFARKKEDLTCNVLGFPESSECVHVGKPLDLLGRFADREKLGMNRAGCYSIHRNVILSRLFGQLTRELFDGSFRAGIEAVSRELLTATEVEKLMMRPYLWTHR